MADPIFDPNLPSVDAVPVAEPIPTFDASLPSEDVVAAPVFNPSQPSENQYTLSDIKAATPQSLADDEDFAPVRFSVANETELQNDAEAQNKIIEAYRLKEAKGSTLLQKGKKAAVGFIPAVGHLVKGAAGAVETLQGLGPGLIPRFVKAGVSGAKEEAKKVAGEVLAIPSSVESNVANYLDIGKGLVRAGVETVKGTARAVTGGGSVKEAITSLGKSELTPEEFRARYFSDLGSAKAAQDAARGQGAVVEALGADADRLKDAGIVIDPQKVQELAVITDPINYVPIGAAVGIVGKGVRSLGKNVIARTLNAEQAIKFSEALNKAKEVAGAVGATAQGMTGTVVKKTGELVESGSQSVKESLRGISGLGAVGLGHLLGHGIYSTLAAVKLAPRVGEKVGQGIAKVGRVIGGEAVSAPTALAGQAIKEGIIGTAEGALITAPFVIGSRTEDEGGILGMIPVAGAARAIHRVVPEAARIAGDTAQDKLAASIFKTVNQSTAPEIAAYGTDTALDTAHNTAVTGLDPQEQKFVNLFRSKFEGSPVEIYAVDRKTMEQRTGNENAAGFAIEQGKKTNPDGTTTPIFRVLLNESSSALPHEAFHAFEFLDPARAESFKKSVAENLTPRELESFGKVYDSALNGGKPESAWTHRLSEDQIAREVAAEAFSRIILGQDLSGVTPSVRKQAAQFASGLLEKIGAPLATTKAAAEVGGSLIGGIRPGTDSVKLGQTWIKELFNLLQREGGVLPATPIKPPALPAPVVPPVKPTQLQLPLSERVPAVQPEPITAPAAPVLPVITPEAQRATVTGAPEALAAAAKLGPEVTARVNELVGHIESGKPVLEIEHSGVKSEGTPEKPLGRTARRAEQEAPDFVREVYEKGLVPDRLVVVGGKPQLLAMSLDKVLTNINRAVKDASIYKVENLIPYESKEGKLTDAGWKEATADLTAYTKNQANGFQGGGDPLVRPATDVGLSIPAETPGYVPTPLSKERADFQNLIQGLATPLTTREVKGQIPGNVKGQVLAEANLRKLETPAAIRPENITKQEFKTQPGRSLKEVNPLRNKLAEAGVPVRELEDVTERINVQNILSMKSRPEVQFNAPVTDIIRGGFSPKPNENTADFGQRILQMDDATFASTMNASKGGLTGLAYDTGLALKDKADLTILKGLADNANAAAQAAMANKDFAGAMPLVMRGQFFREALEAATNTGSAATMLPRLRPGETSPFKAGDFQPKEELSPIKEAAIRTPGGEIFTGSWHGEAAMKLADAIGKGELKESIPKGMRFEAEAGEGYPTGFGEDGFVTQAGEFLNREQAFERAAEIKQIRLTKDEMALASDRWLESGAFESNRNFAPKVGKRDAQNRPLTKDGLVDFEKYYKELAAEKKVQQAKPSDMSKYAATGKPTGPTLTGWILPNKEFVDLSGNPFHEEFIAKNASTLNEKFGTDFSETPSVDERLKALNKGFVRMRLSNSGSLGVELNSKFWTPATRRALEARLQDNVEKIDSVWISLLDNNAKVLDEKGIKLIDLPEGTTPEAAITDGLRELRGGSAAPFPLAPDQNSAYVKQLAEDGKVTHDFWLNSKTGEVLMAPDGHEEMALTILPELPGGKLYEDTQAYDEMFRQGWLRGVNESRESGKIYINGMVADNVIPRFPPEARKTATILSDLYETPVFFNGRKTNIGEDYSGSFSPSEANLPGLKLPSEEQGAQIMAKRKIKKARDRFPEAIVPTFQKSGEGDFLMGDDGKPKPVAIEYGLSDTPVAKEAMKGIRGEAERRDAVASALASGVEKTYRQAIKNPEIKAGEKWYSTARARLKKIFGEDSKFFSELLGATSARTPVDTNYGFALDAYNQFRSGEYDDLIKTYRDGKQKWDSLDLADYVEDTKNENPTRGQFIDWWVEKNDLLPRQSNGKKFGMNSRAVLRVLDGSWREEVQGPKTPNFAGNLSGDTFEATIDVWAARLLHRLANTGNEKRWRILPENETGVTDADFELGQSAFRKAADKIGIKPDALQAILWFGEKNHWEKNGWTRGAGAKKSDFNALLSETETAPTGIKKLKTAQAEFGL